MIASEVSFFFASMATHGLILVFVSVFGEIQFSLYMSHSRWTLRSFISCLLADDTLYYVRLGQSFR